MKTALIVCDDLATMIERVRALRVSGFDTATCEGPASHECPRLWEQPCVLRDAADIAVIEITSDREGAVEEAEGLCTATCGVHGSVIIEGSSPAELGSVVLRRPFSTNDLLLAAAAGYLGASLSAEEMT